MAWLAPFVKQVQSARAEFVQDVTGPARPDRPSRRKTSSGVLELARPGRLRMSYLKPYVQTLLADGKTQWWHDPDLKQVTARPQAEALGDTPMALLTAGTDLQALQKDLLWRVHGEQDGLQWLSAEPRRPEQAIERIELGLRLAPRVSDLWLPDTLRLLDRLGQQTTLRLSAWDLQPRLAPETFVFRPPAGTDILRP